MVALAQGVRSGPPGAGLPTSVRDAVAARLDVVASRDRDVVMTAAVLGRQFALDLLAELHPDHWEGALLAARRADLVALGSETAAFTHALVRDAIYDQFDAVARAERHAAVADAIARIHARALEGHLSELAHHALRAPAEIRQTRGIAAGVAAAAHARRSLAYEEAAEIYEATLSAALEADVPAAERCDLLIAAGEAHVRSGAIDRGRAHLERGFELAEEIGSFRHLARAAEWFAGPTVGGGSFDQRSVHLLERALAAAPDEEAEFRPLLLGRLAQELSMSDVSGRAASLAEAGIAAARQSGSLRTLAETGLWAYPAICGPDRNAEATVVLDDALAAAIELKDVELEIRARVSRTNLSFEEGRVLEFFGEIDLLRELRDGVRVPFLRWIGGFEGFLAHLQGDLEGVAARSAETLEAFPGIGDSFGEATTQQVAVAWDRAQLAPLEPVLRMAAAGRPGAEHLMLALVYAGRAQAREDVGAEFDEVVEVQERLPLMPFSLATFHWLAEASSLLGDASTAKTLYELMWPFAGRHIALRVLRPVVYWGTVDRDLGNLAAVLGRCDDAVAHHLRGLEAHRRMGSAIMTATSLVELATLVPERADEFLAGAQAILHERDLPWLAQRAELATTAPRHRSAPAGDSEVETDEGRHVSLVREGDVWALAEGRVVTRYRHSKGLDQLATLLERPGIEVHSLELDGAIGATWQGDAGPLLDEVAKRAYRLRVEDLDDRVAEAEAFGDQEAAAAAQAELDAVMREVSAAVGLGGRDRRAGGAAEQARINVAKLVRRTIARVGERHPDLERHLRATIRTGAYCCYEPSLAERPLVWDISR